MSRCQLHCCCWWPGECIPAGQIGFGGLSLCNQVMILNQYIFSLSLCTHKKRVPGCVVGGREQGKVTRGVVVALGPLST